MEGGSLISVRTEVVIDVLVDSMTRAVAERMDDLLLPTVEANLPLATTVGGGAALPAEVATRLARAGWHSRTVERERFERAREEEPAVARRLADADACAGLARREPLERPQPDDARATTWQIPGPGGHVRHYLALRALAEFAGPDPPSELKRCWVFGFLLASARPGGPA